MILILQRAILLFKATFARNTTMMKKIIAGASIAAALLPGCGGGSASTTTPPPTPVITTFSGVAATDKALANATITITCASGSATTSTQADGSYSKEITNVTLPCIVQASGADGSVLYSITSATATSNRTQRANVTPLTHLLVASVSGTDPASFFTRVSATPSSISSVVTDSTISAAQTAVQTSLSNSGINTTNLPNLINGDLVVGNASNPYAVALSNYSNTQISVGTGNLPAPLQLQPAALGCAVLRSSDYVVLAPTLQSNMANQIDGFRLNASTLTVTNKDGSIDTLSGSTEPCHYLATNTEAVVSPAGILVVRSVEGGVARMRLAIPQQNLAVSELSGSWNAMGFEANADGTRYAANTSSATIGSNGVFSDVSACSSAAPSATCSGTGGTSILLRSNAQSGFDLVGSGASSWTDRAFAYRAGNGNLMMVSVSGNGSFYIWTQKRALSLPTVGKISAKSWVLALESNGAASGIGIQATNTVTGVDAGTDSYTNTVNLANGVPDFSVTVLQNSPRAGYNFIAASSSVSVANGRTVNIAERTGLPLGGTGISVQAVPMQSGITMEDMRFTVAQP
jgi:hypothetical protein